MNWKCGRRTHTIQPPSIVNLAGQKHRHEHDAGLPAQSALGPGSQGFQQRIDNFSTIAARHHIRPVFVLFDSCWEPFPKLGPQHPPIPGVHNSGWVQAPGAAMLNDPSQYPRLEGYVKGIVGAFANDSRILAWDVWNEPR